MEDTSTNYYPSPSDEVNLDLIFEDPSSKNTIFLSSQSAAYNLDLLLIYEIKSVLTVAKHMDDLPFPKHFEYKIIPIEDLPSENLNINEGVDFIST